jgi:hypothetical protein
VSGVGQCSVPALAGQARPGQPHPWGPRRTRSPRVRLPVPRPLVRGLGVLALSVVISAHRTLIGVGDTLNGSIVIVWGSLNTHVSAAMGELIAARD